MIYSIIKIKKEDKKNSNYAFIKVLVLIISEIFAIIVAIINILQAIGLI